MITGRNFEYPEALRLIQNEDYLDDADIDELRRIDVQKEIGEFYGKMPSSSHRVTTLDAQPISQKMLNGINSVLVSGNDSFDPRYNHPKNTVFIGSDLKTQKMNHVKASGTVKWNATGGGQAQMKSFTQENFIKMS